MNSADIPGMAAGGKDPSDPFSGQTFQWVILPMNSCILFSSGTGVAGDSTCVQNFLQNTKPSGNGHITGSDRIVSKYSELTVNGHIPGTGRM